MDVMVPSHPAIWSVLARIVPMASQNGATNRIRRTPVMAVTARLRRPHNRASTRRMIGHVAITRVAAQTIAGRNGRRIHRQMTTKPAMKKTPSVVRPRSLCKSRLMLWV